MFHAGNTILTIINNLYEGGAIQFSKDNGSLMPYPDDKGVIIHQPNMDETFKNNLLKYSTDEYTIEITEKLNGINPLDILVFITAFNLVIPNGAIGANPIALTITVPNDYVENELFLIMGLIRKHLPKVQRAFIIFNNTYEEYKREDSITENKTPDTTRNQPQIIEGETIRDTIIAPDEITNLIIELALCNDVKEFINKI